MRRGICLEDDVTVLPDIGIVNGRRILQATSSFRHEPTGGQDGGRMAGKREQTSHPLVLGYLERIASSAFSEFPQQITDLVQGKWPEPSTAGTAYRRP